MKRRGRARGTTLADARSFLRMAGSSPFARAFARVRGADSAADRDGTRELRRAIQHAARRKGEPEAVQFAGQPLMPADYARWRANKLRQGAVFTAPDLRPGRYALVLFAIDLTSSEEFGHSGAGGLLTQPTVGTFEIAVEPTLALTGMLTAWLERYPRPVHLAPPLLQQGGRWRVADLELDWALEPNEP